MTQEDRQHLQKKKLVNISGKRPFIRTGKERFQDSLQLQRGWGDLAGQIPRCVMLLGTMCFTKIMIISFP